MNQYRLSSSSRTGRAPRSMSAAFGCSIRDPLYPMPDPHHARTPGRRVSDAIQLLCNAGRDFLAALFGR